MNVQLKKETLEGESPKFRNFDWEKAKSFYYIAKCGSFANAARFLNISQSALSRQVLHLEYHLGCPLFIRHSEGIKLTRKGKEIFAVAEMAFLGFKGATQDTHATTANGKKRKIKIATTHAITAYILDRLIFAYHKKCPHLVFELITDDHLIDIVLNDVDIAIRPYDAAARGVQQEELFFLEKKLYASSEYIEKYGEPQCVEDLKNHHIIAPAHPEDFPYAELTWILKLGLTEGQAHEPIFTSTSIESLVKAAENGLGIIGSYEKMEIIKNSQLKNILPLIKERGVKWYFIFPSHLQKDDEILAFRNYLQEAINI